jgi:predicted ABC-type ATPase
MADKPSVIVLGGPNGAGKSTAAAVLLPPDMIFVNANEIAKTCRVTHPVPRTSRRADCC